MWQVLVGGVAAIAALGGAYYAGSTAGWNARDVKVKAEIIADQRADMAAQREAQTAGFRVGQEYGQAHARIETRTVTRLQKVKDYVSYFDDSACQLSAGFVRHAEGDVDGAAAGERDAAPSGLTHADLLRYIVTVQGAYDDVAARLVGAQDHLTALTGAKAWSATEESGRPAAR